MRLNADTAVLVCINLYSARKFYKVQVDFIWGRAAGLEPLLNSLAQCRCYDDRELVAARRELHFFFGLVQIEVVRAEQVVKFSKLLAVDEHVGKCAHSIQLECQRLIVKVFVC